MHADGEGQEEDTLILHAFGSKRAMKGGYLKRETVAYFVVADENGRNLGESGWWIPTVGDP